MQGHFGKLDEGHDPVPEVVRVSEVPVKVLFAPDHNPEMEIMKQMARARKRIDFAIFTFAESSGIDDQMIALSRGGISIRGALDGRMANQLWAARHGLLEEATGIKLWSVPSQKPLSKLHHKLMVIDEQVVIASTTRISSYWATCRTRLTPPSQSRDVWPRTPSERSTA